MAGQLSVQLLGKFAVQRNGQLVTQFGSDTARGLLAYLVMEPDIEHPRTLLASLLWPELDDSSALRNLRVALSRLRKAIGDQDAVPPYFDVSRRTILLNRSDNVAIDVAVVQQALRRVREHPHAQLETCVDCAQRLEVAAEFYQGELLEGFSINSIAFDEWLLLERENLHWQVLQALYNLTTFYEHQANHEAVVAYARRQVELEPWREIAYRQWMRALALEGQRSAALNQYYVCRQVLSEELGVEPEAETVQLYERIRDGGLTPLSTGHASHMPKTLPRISAGPSSPEQPSYANQHTALPAPQAAPPAPAALAPGAERRMITVLRAELAGSEALLRQLDTETWANIVRHMLNTVGNEVYRYEGRIYSYDQHGLVALFGVDEVHEDDAERAVLAALAMQNTCQTVCAARQTQLLSGVSVALGMRVGVCTDEAIVTPSAIEEHNTGSDHIGVMSKALTAARLLMPYIQPGQVLVDASTRLLVSSSFTWETSAADLNWGHEGFRPLQHQPDGDKGRLGMASELVGRDRELAQLQDIITQAQSGIGQIVTLVGDAGIGKSRLVAECQHLNPLRVQWHEGRCVSYGGMIAYFPFINLLRSMAGMSMTGGRAPGGDHLRRVVTDLCPACFDATYPYLAKLLSVPLDAEHATMLAQLDVDTLKQGTFQAVAALLEGAATKQPLVIVLEDMHWADPSSLELLMHLLSLTERIPLVFICVFRPDRSHGSWVVHETSVRDYPHRHTEISLSALTDKESAQLIDNLLISLPGPEDRNAVVGLPPDFQASILERCEGNPFYVEELLRSLVHCGAIECDVLSCRWQPSASLVGIPVPQTLYGVLRSRIDRLPRGAQRTLQLASVIGRIFPYRLLAEIADRRDLDDHLVILQREQLIRERTRTPEAEFIFEHQLTQEAAYDSLLQRMRRTLHQRVAEGIERLYPDRRDVLLGMLAYHWQQSGNSERAVDYYYHAGEKAAAQFANKEALTFLEQALSLLPLGDLERRYSILLLVEHVQDRQGEREGQLATLQMLQRLADELDDGSRDATYRQTEVALHLAGYYNITMDSASLAETADRVIGFSEHIDAPAMAAHGYLYAGTALVRTGNVKAGIAHFEQALRTSRETGDRRLQALVLREFGVTALNLSHYATANDYIKQALQIHRDLGNRQGESRSLNALAVLMLHRHKPSTSLVYAGEAIRLCRMIGLRREEAYALGAMGTAYLGIGMYQESKVHINEALALSRAIDDRYGQGYSLAILAWISYYMGSYDDALAYVQQAMELAGDANGREIGLQALIVKGRVAEALQDWQDAISAYQQALELGNALNMYPRSVSAQSGLASVAYQQGILAKALSHVEVILHYTMQYPDLYGTRDPAHVYQTVYQVLNSFEDSRAEQVLENAHSWVQRRYTKLKNDVQRDAFLHNIPEIRDVLDSWNAAREPR